MSVSRKKLFKMKSKSFDTKQSGMDQVKENKTFEFVKLYKSAAETKQYETTQCVKTDNKINKSFQSELDKSKRSRSPGKNKKKKDNETLDLSNIEAVGTNIHISSKTRSLRKKSLTSTPNNKGENIDTGVKSIMKSKSGNSDTLLNVSNDSIPSSKPKKRNKSVSFMLEDAEEVVIKKVKANVSSNEHKNLVKERENTEKLFIKSRKQKKGLQSKENQNLHEDNIKINYKLVKEKAAIDMLRKDKEPATLGILTSDEPNSEVRKKAKKAKKSKRQNEGIVIPQDNVPDEQSSENKAKKLKKKKRKAKSLQDANVEAEADGEPAFKTRKREIKPETIAEGLENLNIGDNTHTLTNLLDEMSVVDKNKMKKDRQKQKRNKLKKTLNSDVKLEEVPEHGTNTEEKEKVKWNKRKWNKDTKGASKPRLQSSVVVENLPLKIMCTFKTMLSEHFGKFGTIAGIGVAETYPTESPKPVFTTTVYFQDDEAATKALEEDNAAFEGSRIRVRRPLPATETTLVVRARAALTDQAVSSAFSSAGRIRNIRHSVKGKKAMPTVFVEFDGPEAVERALRIAEDATICGKKMLVSKFLIRDKRKCLRPENKIVNDNDDDSSSE